MTPKFIFSIDRSSDADFTLVLLAAGKPLQTGGYEAYMQLRDCKFGLIDTLSTKNGRLVFVEEGKVQVTFPREYVASYPVGVLAWDMLLESPDGRRTKVVEGEVIVNSGVTCME